MSGAAYEEALQYLEGLKVFGVRLGLSRIERLLEILGNPQNSFKSIHVTGTNGKGSTSAMLYSILRHAEVSVGLYTSPHLVSYTERAQIDGAPISEEEFASCLMAIREAGERMIAEGDEPPTQFEVLTAMAFLAFSRRGVEYAVIEVGLGGLLDSTNVIVPEVSVITNVTLEHADRCGGTLAGVAHHKAGIIKEGVPVITAASGEPLPIIEETAREKHAEIFAAGRDFSFALEEGQELSFAAPALGLVASRYKVGLWGLYQGENAALALMTALILGKEEPRLSGLALRKGLERAAWPCRFERMSYRGTRLVIDGAHNPAGMEALRESLDYYYGDSPRVFLLGILHDKDIENMLAVLLRPVDSVVVTTPHSERAEIASHLAQMAEERAQSVAVNDWNEALKKACELAGTGLLVVTGSLYLVGGLRELIKRGEA